MRMPFVRGDGTGSAGPRSSGFRSGTKNSDKLREPAEAGPVRASATETSPSVALENHLKPFKEYTGPYGLDALDTGVATVSVWETSEPPGR